ncbi:MAG: hypothetical protein WAL25_15485 [Acidimicrobiia bacterium]
MRPVIARCTVDYTPVVSPHIPEATRLIMLKAYGTLACHSDGDTSKPRNRYSDLSGPDVDRADKAEEILGGGVSVRYVEDDFLVAILGETCDGMGDYVAC